jgi:ketosteroid isomerase-like protein
MNSPPHNSLEQEIAAVLQSFVALLEDPDTHKRVDMYTSDVTFVRHGVLIEGEREIADYVESAPVLREVTLTPLAIDANDHLASVYGVYTGLSGEAEEKTTLRFLFVLRRGDDSSWRVVREFLTPEPDPAG